MGAGTSASTFIRQGATASCNVTSLVTGATGIAIKVKVKGSLLIDYGDGNTEYLYDGYGSLERKFSHVYSEVGNKNIIFKGNINTITQIRSGSGVPMQAIFGMEQTETAKLKSLVNLTFDDPVANVIYDTEKLPSSMVVYYNSGVNASYGSIGTTGTSYLPATLQNFTGSGTAEVHTGSISSLPSGLGQFLTGELCNFTGSIDNLPPTLYRLTLRDDNSVITGNIENLPLTMTTFGVEGKNSIPGQIISGDLGTTLNNRQGLSSFVCYGLNTITCNFTTFDPQGATGMTIDLRSPNSTVSGNISQIPSRMRSLFFSSVFNLSGNISSLPQTLENLRFYGVNSSIITGDISSLSTKPLTNFLIIGMTNHTITGDIGSLSNTIKSFTVQYGSIYGDISSLSSKTELEVIQITSGTGAIVGNVSLIGNSIRTLHLTGTGVNLIGDIGQIPQQVSYIALNKGNFNYITRKTNWASNMQRIAIASNAGAGNFLTTAMVDNLLIDLAQYATTWSGDKLINLIAGNEARSNNATIDAAVLTLQNRGVTVNTKTFI